MKIELLRGKVLNRVISANTSIGSGGSGSASWTVPYNQPQGSDYKVRITSRSYPAYNDTSNGNFTIRAGAPVTVTAPNGGQNWIRGTTRTITWNYTGSPGPFVRIDLMRGTSVTRIIKPNISVGSGGLGSYGWTIPFNQTPGTDYKIRVTSRNNAAYTDMGNANFTIGAGAPVTVTAPNGGQDWKRGSTQIIKWNYTGNPGAKVKIELIKGTNFYQLINASTSVGSGGSGSYAWIISYNTRTGPDYKIRINSTSNALFTDISDTFFTISW